MPTQCFHVVLMTVVLLWARCTRRMRNVNDNHSSTLLTLRILSRG